MKKNRSPDRTRMWELSIGYESGQYIVTARPAAKGPRYTGGAMFIRAITGRAAARRFIRNNLASLIARNDYELNNPFTLGDTDVKPWMLKKKAKHVRNAVARVER